MSVPPRELGADEGFSHRRVHTARKPWGKSQHSEGEGKRGQEDGKRGIKNNGEIREEKETDEEWIEVGRNTPRNRERERWRKRQRSRERNKRKVEK